MSTVNKAIADRIISGEFPEDDIVCIIRYENCFNGNFAYKILDSRMILESYLEYLFIHCFQSMIDPIIYWKKEGLDTFGYEKERK